MDGCFLTCGWLFPDVWMLVSWCVDACFLMCGADGEMERGNVFEDCFCCVDLKNREMSGCEEDKDRRSAHFGSGWNSTHSCHMLAEQAIY